MVSDLKDRLEPLGQLPLLDGVATAIADHYRRTEQRAPSMDAAQRRNRAAVSALMGDIYRARSALPEREKARKLGLSQRNLGWCTFHPATCSART